MALPGSRVTPETADLMRPVLRATDPAGFMQLARFGVTDPSALDFAAEPTLPVLLIHGKEDQAWPLAANAVPLAEALPDARLVELDWVGHFPAVADWRTVNRLVADFLAA